MPGSAATVPFCCVMHCHLRGAASLTISLVVLGIGSHCVDGGFCNHLVRKQDNAVLLLANK